MDEPVQKGGMDPGLAALIAALLTGSVGSYGYLNNKESAESIAEAKLQSQIDAANKTVAAANDATRAKEAVEATLKTKEAELTALKAQLEALKSSASTTSEFAVTFKNATPDAITRAVPEVLKAMHFNPDGSDAPNVKSALEYPGSYQGRLMRMSLFDFYYKRLKPAFEKDVAKAKKGGDVSMSEELAALETAPEAPLGAPGGPGSAAMYSPYLPDYDAFAKMYTDAIKASTRTASAIAEEKATDKQAQADKKAAEKEAAKSDKNREKADKAARQAAIRMADKLAKAVTEAKDELETSHTFVQSLDPEKDYTKTLMETKAKLEEDIDIASKKYLKGYRRDTGPSKLDWLGRAITLSAQSPYYGGADDTSLVSVKTVEDWNRVKGEDDAPMKLLETIVSDTDDYMAAYDVAANAMPWFKKSKPKEEAKPPTGPTTIHDKLLADTPAFLKKVSGMNEEVKKMMKGLDDGMKQIPMPEQYKSGCAVKVLVQEMQDILRKISPVIARRITSLQKSLDDYKKETKGTPIYDTSLQRSETEETELAKDKSEIDSAVADVNKDIETFFATVQRMKGGARALQKVFDLRHQIDLGVYALKSYSANIVGLKDSYESILEIIERTKENRLETPAEWEEEKKSCSGQVETLRKELADKAAEAQVVPVEIPDEETIQIENPLRIPPPSPAVSGTTGEPMTPTSVSSTGPVIAPEVQKSLEAYRSSSLGQQARLAATTRRTPKKRNIGGTPRKRTLKKRRGGK